MSLYVVDVEADNATPATGSMVCFGAVRVAEGLTDTFYGHTAPITETWNPDALKISGYSREEHEKFKPASITIHNFYHWVNKTNNGGRPVFISDNPAFDFSWISFYFDRYNLDNPFGWSGRRIGDIYCGLVKDASKNGEWKRKYRKTKHTHHPVSDNMGNAEALLAFKNKLGLKIKFD